MKQGYFYKDLYIAKNFRHDSQICLTRSLLDTWWLS